MLGLRVHGRLAVVAGGGAAAQRRVASLLADGADVVVVAPALSGTLDRLAAGGLITARRREYVASDLDEAWLAVACTGQPRLDAAVAAEAARRRIWCATEDGKAASLAWLPDESEPAAGAGTMPAAAAGTLPAAAAGSGARTGTAAAARTGSGAGTGSGASTGTEPATVRFASSGQRVLVLGGARSGKSVTAERLLAGHARVDYIATGQVPAPEDAEWSARVHAHQRRRPAGWRTIETLDVERELAAAGTAAPAAGTASPAAGTASQAAGTASPAAVLIDCLSTWLAGVLDECGVWAGRPDADHALAHRIAGLVAAWRTTGRQVVAVSNEVGSGVVPGTISGRRFRDELGCLNARIAAECDEVWLCTAGIARRLR